MRQSGISQVIYFILIHCISTIQLLVLFFISIIYLLLSFLSSNGLDGWEQKTFYVEVKRKFKVAVFFFFNQQIYFYLPKCLMHLVLKFIWKHIFIDNCFGLNVPNLCVTSTKKFNTKMFATSFNIYEKICETYLIVSFMYM